LRELKVEMVNHGNNYWVCVGSVRGFDMQIYREPHKRAAIEVGLRAVLGCESVAVERGLQGDRANLWVQQRRGSELVSKWVWTFVDA
jgi:hypothetical protein